ncbi:MAG: anion permease, partial [Polyangiaceae bacterium]|nr:anion permease [Polyangiaceae bacterium]
MLDRRTVGAALAPLAFIGLLAAPLQLEPRAHRLVAIFAAVMIAWVCEVVPIAVTALAIGPLLVVMDVTDAATAFRYYGDPLLFLFIGGFMLAEAMRRHGLDRRFAHAVVSLPFVRGSAWRTQVAIVCAAALMSMWISNTATCAIFVPLLLGTSGLAKLPKEGASRDPATGPLLALAYVCSTGGLGTPLGSPPNLITIRLLESAGVQLGFVEWLAIGVPSAIVLSIVAAVITMRNGRGDEPVDGEQLVEPSARWSRGERVTAVCFAAAVIGWALPAVVEATGASIAGALNRSMHVGAVAILACIPLFVLRDPSRRDTATGEMPSMLPWSSAVKIDWGVILLFGGGISLGTQLEETGLAGAIAEAAVLA